MKSLSIFEISKNHFMIKDNSGLGGHCLCYRWRCQPWVVGNNSLWLTLKIAPGVLAIHCIIHEQHVVPENFYERLYKSINVFNRTNNTINNKSLSY